jgi:hypothetical protein
MLFYKHYFSPLNTFMRKEKDPDPYLRLMDPGGPKTCGSETGSIPLTNGSGSRRPKNMRIRLRIPNTSYQHQLYTISEA